MTFLLAKVGAAALDPVALFFMGLLAALLLRTVRLRRTAAVVAVVACVGIWTASLPVSARLLMWQLERSYPPVSLERSSAADAAILLGGGVEADVPPRTKVELISGADRIMHAADLFRA